jgi:hypothetical protein
MSSDPATVTSTATDTSVKDLHTGQLDVTLRAADILIEEFRHASSAANQSKQDQNNLLYFYLLAIGATITGLQLIDGLAGNARSYQAFIGYIAEEAGVFVLVGVASFLFVARSLSLGREYQTNVLTMSAIKEFYIDHLKPQLPEIEQAFHLRPTRVPWAARLGGSTPVLIALVGSLAFALSGPDLDRVWNYYNPSIPFSSAVGYASEGLFFTLAVIAFSGYFLISARRQRSMVVQRASQTRDA